MVGIAPDRIVVLTVGKALARSDMRVLQVLLGLWSSG